MPWAEDNRNALAVRGFKFFEEGSDTLHPESEFLFRCRVVEDFLYDGIIADIPGCAPCYRIAWVPADGDDTPTLMVTDDFLADSCERHTVEVLGITHLDTTKVEAHNGGIIADGGKDIALACVPFPFQAIEGIILMAKHIATLLEALQTLQEQLGDGGWLGFLRRSEGGMEGE